MGILNVTPDSFSDGGKFLDDPEEAGAGAQERALAGSVGPGQVDDLPSVHEEVGTGESGEPAEQDDGSGQRTM